MLVGGKVAVVVVCSIFKIFIRKTSMQHSSDELVNFFLGPPSPKASSEAAQILQSLFGSPATLLSHTGSLASATSQSGLEVGSVFSLYERIGSLGRDSDLLILVNKTFNDLVGEGVFKAYLSSAEQLKYFLMVVLWDKMFRVKNYEFVAIRALEYIQKAEYYRDIFSKWLQDLPADYLQLLVSSMHGWLQSTLNQLVEKPQTEQSNRQVSGKSLTICYFLSLLFQSNKNQPRLPLSAFNNPFLTQLFQPVEQFKIYLTKSSNFNFVDFPFLLDFDYKYRLMQIESAYEQKMNIRKNMEKGLSAMIQEFDLQGGQGVEGLLYLCIAVRREFILDDSMEKLGKVKGNLRSPLRIEFVGEEGTDEGGVRKEYFSMLTKEIFNPYLDMFVPRNSGRFYWFNGFSYEMPVRFEFVGMLLGLALYNSVHLDIHFPEVIFKKLLQENYEEDHGLEIVEDLREIEPEIYRSLKDILTTTEPLDQLELYFNIQLESFGEPVVEDLVEEGSQIKLSQDNREEYCLLYADYLLNRHTAKQFTPFRTGFYKVVGPGIVETFEPEELSALINGKDEISISELEASTTYEGGYSRETPVVKHLWEFLHSLNDGEKKQFLTFVTGTDRVPIEGLKALKFNIQRHANTGNLPTAHTCFNVLLLPPYESPEVLQKNMRLILEHNQGFGLI